MPYIVALIVLVWLPITGLAYLLRGRFWRGFILRMGISVTALVAFAAPWINYLVAARVWYYDTSLLLGPTLFYAPFEEYLFFGLLPILCALVLLWVWRRVHPEDFT